MDISTLDRATARLVAQLRLDEIIEVLQRTELETDMTSSYRILRHALQHQLEIIDEDVSSIIAINSWHEQTHVYQIRS